jgi:hypothetical protein
MTHSEIKGAMANKNSHFAYLNVPPPLYDFPLLFWVSGINTHWTEPTKVKVDENSWEEK